MIETIRPNSALAPSRRGRLNRWWSPCLTHYLGGELVRSEAQAKMVESLSQEPTLTLRDGVACFSSLLLLTDEDFRKIHPDDLSAVRRKYPNGWQLHCFRYGGQHIGYDVLDDGELHLRVRDAVIRPIPEPRFRRGDQVFAHPKQAVGVVRDVIWHLNRRRVYYLLVFDGRPSGRWYFEGDLESPGNAVSLGGRGPGL